MEGAISGFSLSHLLSSTKQVQPLTAKPIYVSHIVFQKSLQREVVVQPSSTPANSDLLPVPEDLINPLKECVYDVDDFLPQLSYDHPNQAALKATFKSLVLLLETRPRRARTERVFKVPVNFLNDETYDQLPDPASGPSPSRQRSPQARAFPPYTSYYLPSVTSSVLHPGPPPRLSSEQGSGPPLPCSPTVTNYRTRRDFLGSCIILSYVM